MKILGISEGFHDAGACLIDGQDILYASHSERYSRIKNDKNIHPEQRKQSDKIVFYEKPFSKNLRRLYAGQKWKSRPKADCYISHHWSHAAAAYYTRPWEEEPVCVVIDAIGEWDTASIWWKKKKVWSMRYPQSLGLFYSAMTHYIGLKPMEDEHIMMGMAAFGNAFINMDYIFSQNLHRGCKHIAIGAHEHNIAASAQRKLEEEIIKIMNRAKKYSNYLCYSGGVALNCVANTKVHNMFDKMWIFPNPGDAGSSLGAAAAYLDRPIKFDSPYLGYNIEGEINVKEVITHLLDYSYCGIANGRAEFGPRALGNRSLIADPRRNIKDTVNKIKRRQQFRPFAPAILEEYADEYFDGPMNEYMQYVAKAKHDYKSVTHVDGTARVQIVKQDCKSIIRKILEEWYEQTECPMLLNTSLNIKGQPIVNTWKDAVNFREEYNVKVF